MNKITYEDHQSFLKAIIYFTRANLAFKAYDLKQLGNPVYIIEINGY